MIGVDFRDPTPLERLQRLCSEAIDRSREVRATLILAGTLLVLLGIESIRLLGIVHTVHDLEQRRDIVTTGLRAMQSRTRSIEERRTALMTALNLRRSSVMFANRMAMLTDSFAPTIALTSVRGFENGFDVEGRGVNLADLRTSFQRLQARVNTPAAFEVHREEGMHGVVSFRLTIVAK